MALRFMDGFDHMGGSTGLATKYSTSNGSVSTASARTGANGMSLGSSGAQVTRPLPASGGFVFGCAVKVIGAVAWGTIDLFQAKEGTIVHLTMGCNGSSILQVKRGSTVIATGTQVLGQNNWYYLEFKGVIHVTTGSYEVRIDGVTDIINTVPTNTQNGGLGQWDRLQMNGANHNFDDLYICDTSGTTNNTFLGPCKIQTLLPSTDFTATGSNQGLTPSTGTDHGALVDEVIPNITDFNSSSTPGAKDTYRFPALAGVTGSILGIQTNIYAAKTDAGTQTICSVVRAGGTDYDGPTAVPTTSFGYVTNVREINPFTGLAWTSADIATIEVGMKVVS
jgi:hypothetical protein